MNNSLKLCKKYPKNTIKFNTTNLTCSHIWQICFNSLNMSKLTKIMYENQKVFYNLQLHLTCQYIKMCVYWIDTNSVNVWWGYLFLRFFSDIIPYVLLTWSQNARGNSQKFNKIKRHSITFNNIWKIDDYSC